jgi:hypothetical protein
MVIFTDYYDKKSNFDPFMANFVNWNRNEKFIKIRFLHSNKKCNPSFQRDF